MNITNKTVFWFSSQNWRKKNDIHGTDHTQSPDYEFHQITDYHHDWENLFLHQEIWLHAVVVITEPVLLMMNDPEYKKSLFCLFRTLASYKIEHSVLVQYDIYNGTLNHFPNYYFKYLYRKMYDLHQKAFYQTFRCVNFQKSGNLLFHDFMSYYLVILVSQFHDHGYMNYAIDIMDRVQGFFDEHEKERIGSPSSRLVYDFISDPTEEDEKVLLKRIRDYDLPYKMQNACDSDSRVLGDLKDWKEVEDYLFRYGKNRKTNESQKRLQQTLDDKLFYTLLRLFGLEISGEALFPYIRDMKTFMQEIKDIEGLNVVPYESEEDFQSYVDSYLGESRHIIFQNYILHDKLYADEFDKFLTMFQEYMAKIRKIDIKFEKEQTERGTLYTIKSYSPELVRKDFSDYTEDFHRLLDDIYKQSDDHIETIISKYHLPLESAEALIQKYKRELNRIMIDAKYSCLSKISTFYRNLEEEANNESTVIRNEKFLELQAAMPSNVFHPTLPQIDKALQEFMNGEPKFDKAYKKVEETINKYADSTQKEELLYALNVSFDSGLNNEARENAKQKLTRFLIRINHLNGDLDLGPEWISPRPSKTVIVSYAKDSTCVSFLSTEPPKSLVGKFLVIEGELYRVVFVASEQQKVTLERPVQKTGSGTLNIFDSQTCYYGSDLNAFY